MNINKELILSEIKSYYKIKTDADFARFLGIKPQTLSSWYTRNSFDIELLYAKCVEISPDWLLTGKGEMLRNSINQSIIDNENVQTGNNNIIQQGVNVSGDNTIGDNNKNCQNVGNNNVGTDVLERLLLEKDERMREKDERIREKDERLREKDERIQELKEIIKELKSK